ncbi:MAG: helix-turn-helix domain-containing protein [Muribaculaceae bacterium]|nr:helix-turn-helix domain-containing protein [Anaeroplasma bactoclasticum]MCM1296271.1 helix-turn-helix domain-containing protein [Muribaculaceae bacterium]MCM1556389.1 helix-turn-helix domain-containing protein [Anaeroplasma bactoclasticum]
MFYDNIKRFRLNKNWTQEDLAEKLNVTRQTISKWEQGINEPDIATFKKLSCIFEVSLDELLGLEEQKKVDKFPYIVKICNIVSISFCVFISLVLVIFIRYLYNKIPMHYNWDLEIDRLGSKWEWLFMLAYFIGILVTDLLCCRLVVGMPNSKASFWITKICCWCSQIVGLGIFFGFAGRFLKKDTWYPITNGVVYSFLFCFSIFLHPSIIKRNSYFGFITKFTCSNDVAWNKINRFTCYVLCINSFIAIIIQMFVNQFWYNFLISNLLCIGLLIVCIYYFHVKHKLK